MANSPLAMASVYRATAMAIAMTSNTWRGLGTWAKPLSNASPQSAHSSLAYSFSI